MQQLRGEVVTIEVGAAKNKYNVHLALLCEQSPKLKTFLQNKSGEVIARGLDMHDVKTTIFEQFLRWLYRRSGFDWFELRDCPCGDLCRKSRPDQGKLSKPLTPDEEIELEAILEKKDETWPEYRLYAFAHQYDIPNLRRDIIDCIWKYNKYSAHAWFADVVLVARLVPLDDPLMRLLTDSVLDDGCPNQCRSANRLLTKVPQEIVCRLWLNACEPQARVEEIESELKSMCAYHEHAQDENIVKKCEAERAEARKRKRVELGDDPDTEQWAT